MNHVCPRCLGRIPNNENPGAYMGALSRTDNKTEICSACGSEEAMQDFIHGEIASQKYWLINLAQMRKAKTNDV